ncbi:MAG: site-2 protease family protein [Oscillospiraceae bacterium]|nr:site-2 protease family protein [Oscillospiraceae bacterium]
MNSLSDLWNSLDFSAILSALLRLAAVLLCLSVHETAHGLAAWMLGDETAKGRKRLSLNPLHHIDWFGLAAMLLRGFGWAKPVPIDPNQMKHPKSGMALTALAGLVSNLLLSVFCFFAAGLIYRHGSTALFSLFSFLVLTATLSIGLGVFNLIPIPPLDGGKVFFALLPEHLYWRLLRYERYGILLVYALVFFGALDGFLNNAITAIVGFIFGIMLR